MRNVMREVAESIGVEPWYGAEKIKLGLIQSTPIRYGWEKSDFNETAFKEEISDRTEINIVSNDGEKLYTIKRTHHGEIIFKVEKKSEALKRILKDKKQ